MSAQPLASTTQQIREPVLRYSKEVAEGITLATLSQATAQEVFDHIVRGMRAQGFQRSLRNGLCVYRGTNGRAGPAGHCMTDKEYRTIDDNAGRYWLESIEGNSWEDLVFSGAVPTDHAGMIIALQYVHDASKTPAEMVRNLRRIAESYNLDPSAITG